MTVEIRDPGMNDVISPDAEPTLVAGGFGFTEGPVWHPTERVLVFSDMPHDHMRRWTPDTGISTFRTPSGKANGNAYDARGRLVTCEHSYSRVTRTEPDGSLTVLADRYQGYELNSPNDVIVAPDASIYFTDPTFGRLPTIGVARDAELSVRGVYRIRTDTDGSLELLLDDFAQPNGLCFSVDGRFLFVNDSERGHIRRFPVAGDGNVQAGEVWATLDGDGEGVADGLKTDSAGNLYCAGPGGIHVYAPDGRMLGVVRTPEVCANFTWGDDPDLTTLLACASTGLYRFPVRTPGLPSIR